MQRRATPSPSRPRSPGSSSTGNGDNRSLRPVPAQRLLIDIAAPRQFAQTGWTADLRTTGIPALHTDGGSAIHVGWHAELSGLIEELDRITSALRQWWPQLDVRVSYAGSAAAARKLALRNGVILPR